MRPNVYYMKTRGNEPTFSKNERKCAATAIIPAGSGMKPKVRAAELRGRARDFFSK